MYQDIIHFWFTEIQPEQWWQKNIEFDALIKVRFGVLHPQAAAGELAPRREAALGALAEELAFLEQPDSSF